MKNTALLPAFLLLVSAMTSAQAVEPSQDPLFQQVAKLDNEAFDAFNRCSDPAQLQKHAGYFDANVEFYHDTGGVTWTREAMLENTRKHACGHYTRELVDGSLQVFPVKDFGAIAQGSHRFCEVATGKCEGSAKFVMVWQHKDGQWQMTRVLSYGHRALTAAEKAALETAGTK